MEKLPQEHTKRFIVTLGIVSFAFQYAWENLQCAPFFNYAPLAYMAVDMIGAALADVAMTYGVFSCCIFFKVLELDIQ